MLMKTFLFVSLFYVYKSNFVIFLLENKHYRPKNNIYIYSNKYNSLLSRHVVLKAKI